MSKAPQRHIKTALEVRNVAVSFSGMLDEGELLTGTPTVVDNSPPSPEALTFSNIAVSTTALTINGISVPAGEAVQFSLSGGVVNTAYTIKISCGTDATPAQTLYGSIDIRVKADA